MRPKGVLGLLVVIILIGLIYFLLSDRFIERQLENAGESVVGAKVEIDDLHFSLLGLSLSWKRLQVANPNDTWKNLFETGTVAFDMRVAPLARKKVNIDRIQVTGVRIGTRRATDGYLPAKPASEEPGMAQQAAESLKKQVSAAPVLNLGILKKKINVDSLMRFVDIQSIAKITEVQQRAQTTTRKWQQALGQFDPKDDLSKIEQQINELKQQDLKGLKNLVQAGEKAKNIYATLNRFKEKVTKTKKQFGADFGQVRQSFAQVDNWIRNDLNAIKSKANLADFSKQNIGTMLFGQKLSLPLVGWLKYIDYAREYMPVAQKLASSGKVENPPRLEGQDIRFPLTNPDPDFLIRQILVSAASNQSDTSKVISVSGEIAGITSHPKIYGKPLTFQLTAAMPGSNAYTVDGEVDHTGDIPRERFRIRGTGVKMGDISLPPRRYLPTNIAVEKGDLSVELALVGDQLDFRVTVDARPVRFFIPDSLQGDDVISRVTGNVFRSMKVLKLGARVRGRLNDLSLSIQSNIDDVLAQRISGMIGESVKAARAEIDRRVRTLVDPKKQQALAFIQNSEKNLRGEINKLENRINSRLAEVEKKKSEIEQKIAVEKKKAEQGVKKKLKDIFKKN